MTNNTTADLDRDIAHLIDSSENGIARVPRETLVRLRELFALQHSPIRDEQREAARKRVAAFMDAYSILRGADQEKIHSINFTPLLVADLRALLTSPRAGVPAPKGWKLVPIERSYDMRVKALLAFNTTEKETNDRDDALDAAHRAMLDTAPAAPVAEAAPYFSGVSELIIRDVCEMEPANPDLNDTICIDVSDLQAIVKRHTEMCATCNGHGMIGGPSFSAPDEGGVPCPDCAAPAAEAKSAENAELASMTRMFHAACSDLGLINEALGLDPDDGGAEPILDAIQKLKEERDQWADAGYAAQAVAADGGAKPSQFFVYDAEGCYFETFATDAERDKAHRDLIAEYRVDARQDQEWPDAVAGIISGIVTHTTSEAWIDNTSCDYEPRAAVSPATADERAANIARLPAMPENVLADLQGALTHLEMWAKGEARYAPSNAYDEPGTRKATITDVTKAAKYLAPRLKEASFALQDYFAAIDRARASQAAAPASVPPFKRYNWDGKECEAGPLVFFLDVLEALKIIEDAQTAAPAEAREPDAYMTLDCVSLKPASVYLDREDVADMRPDHVVPLYRGRVPADAGEAADATRYRWLQRQRAKVWHEIADMPINHTNEYIDAAIAADGHSAQGGKGGEA